MHRAKSVQELKYQVDTKIAGHSFLNFRTCVDEQMQSLGNLELISKLSNYRKISDHYLLP